MAQQQGIGAVCATCETPRVALRIPRRVAVVDSGGGV
jgi:hypothetical protein